MVRLWSTYGIRMLQESARVLPHVKPAFGATESLCRRGLLGLRKSFWKACPRARLSAAELSRAERRRTSWIVWHGESRARCGRADGLDNGGAGCFALLRCVPWPGRRPCVIALIVTRVLPPLWRRCVRACVRACVQYCTAL